MSGLGRLSLMFLMCWAPHHINRFLLSFPSNRAPDREQGVSSRGGSQSQGRAGEQTPNRIGGSGTHPGSQTQTGSSGSARLTRPFIGHGSVCAMCRAVMDSCDWWICPWRSVSAAVFASKQAPVHIPCITITGRQGKGRAGERQGHNGCQAPQENTNGEYMRCVHKRNYLTSRIIACYHNHMAVENSKRLLMALLT